MSLKTIGLLLVTLTLALQTAKGNLQYEFCPDQAAAITKLGIADISAAGHESTITVRTGRLPESGLFPATINCILVNDLTSGRSPAAAVEVTDGGVNQRYVEIKITSHIGKEFNYGVVAYTKD